MSPSRRPVLAVMATLSAIAPLATAQPVPPHIGYVYPPGGRVGSTFQVVIGGQSIENVNAARISGSGVEVKVIDRFKPLNPGQANQLRDKLKELQDKKRASMGFGPGDPTTKPAFTDDDEKMVEEIRKKLATFIRKLPSPAIAEKVTLQVTLAPDAEPGERELRLMTPAAITNPLVFHVGRLPETSESQADPRDGLDRTNGPKPEKPKPTKPPTNRREARSAEPATETAITPPVVVNGQIMPGTVDRYRFKARKNQRLGVTVAARALIPYLPDAVPGWFQAAVAIYDSKGKELVYNDDYRFHPDPVLFYQIPMDGEYVLEIKDALYRGREDFVYRITMGDLPFITGIFPLGGKVGEKTNVALKGWNLPVTSQPQDDSEREPGIYDISVRRGAQLSNRVPFMVDDLPECAEKEPNDASGSAQTVTLPIIVNGRVDKRGDTDVLRFEGKADEEVVTEVHARRLDSPLDSVLRITDASGQELAVNDDHEDKGSGLTTHHADSFLQIKLPSSGTYYVHIADAQDKGGPEYAYRLRISRPRPDFALRVAPSSLGVRAGGTTALTVYALRKDGFTGDITVSLKNPPDGFSLSGGRVPGNQDQVKVTLTANSRVREEPVSLSIEGRATVNGREIRHLAVPAEDMMQAFAYRHLVPSQELLLAVAGRGPQRGGPKILSPLPVKIPAGGTARLQIGAPAMRLMNNIQLELSEAPEGITIQNVLPGREGLEVILKSDGAKAKPGLKGNLIVNAFAERPPEPGAKNKPKNARRFPVATLPAIPFEIVAR